MNRNVGTADRALRTVLGLAAVGGAFWFGLASAAGLVMVVVGAVLLVTAAAGFCPLYRLLGVSTDRNRQHEAEPVTR